MSKQKTIPELKAEIADNAADGTELCALAAAYAAFRLHGGVAAPAHLDGP